MPIYQPAYIFLPWACGQSFCIQIQTGLNPCFQCAVSSSSGHADADLLRRASANVWLYNVRQATGGSRLQRRLLKGVGRWLDRAITSTLCQRFLLASAQANGITVSGGGGGGLLKGVGCWLDRGINRLMI